MKEKHLDYISAIAREGNFSRAAKSLYVSQPSLSQCVQRIEAQYGVPLFERSNSHVTLTKAGALYISAGERMMELERQLENDMRDNAVLKCGRLTIGIAPYRDCYILADALKIFHEQYPNIRIRLYEHRYNLLEDRLLRGDLDFVLAMHQSKNPALRRTRLFTETMLLASAPDYWFFRENDVHVTPAVNGGYPSIKLSDLKDARFIMLSPGLFLRDLADELCADAGFEARVVLESKDINAVHSMAAAALGVTFVPESYVKTNPIKATAEYFRPDGAGTETSLNVICCADRPLSPVAEAFIPLLLKQWQEDEA